MIRVLVVDDDFKVASIHRDFVERIDGFEVAGEAHSGRHALAMIGELQPDLVLLDIYLPDMSGIDVMRELQGSDVDVIAITAARDVATLRSAMRLGALHYLVKPFTFQTLRDKLTSYASWAAALDRAAIIDQPDVDRLVGVLRSTPADRELPKGLSEATMRLVQTTVMEATGPLTAEEVAQRSGISRVTARRYLEHLSRIDLLLVQPVYGRNGRPQHTYSTKQPS